MGGLSVSLAQTAPIPLDAAFECAPGELLALVGPSGSGKTTLLRTIAGTTRVAGGRIEVNGQCWFDGASNWSVPAHRRRVGMVFQSYALFPHMTALDNVAAGLSHLPRPERPGRARELLALVHLEGLEQRRPAELSGGQQQRVAVARALAREPDVLLLDEPFSAVDKATRMRLYREISGLRGLLDMPVVLVTHDLDEAILLADRMVVLHHGRTLQAGTPESVTHRPESEEVARLLDMRNLFPAEVAEQPEGEDVTVVSWAGGRLRAPRHEGFAVGECLTCVVPDGYLIARRVDRPSRYTRENEFNGVIDSVLVIGPAAHLSLRPDGTDAILHFSVAAHVARRHGFVAGTALTVAVLREGIHLMPAVA